MSHRNEIIIGIALVLLVVGTILGFRAYSDRSARIPRDKVTSESLISNPYTLDFSALAERVGKSVVNIRTARENASAVRNPFENLFDRNHPFELFSIDRDAKRRSLGSGFIVHRDGYVLTTSHVVENASRISAELYDKKIVQAVLVGTDPKTDLALLKINNHDLPELTLAATDGIAVGDWVAAFGSPFGLEQTMTVGIISSKGRTTGSSLFNNLLQTDAAINPGNSGGPLVNMRGEVVGVSTIVGNRGQGFSVIGFAIPAPVVRRVYDQLLRSGKVTRGWIGVRVQDITPEIARSFGLNRSGGALIAEATPDSPAAKTGMQSGDIILEFNHQEIRTAHDLLSAVANSHVGSTAPVKLLRAGKELSFEIPVGERPSAVAEIFRSPAMRERGALGITVENVTPEIQTEMRLSSARGVLVTEVAPGSSADLGGVLPGDVIRSINHSPVNRAVDLLAVLGNLKENSTVLLTVERHGQVVYLAFDLS
jgi:serine protease Do